MAFSGKMNLEFHGWAARQKIKGKGKAEAAAADNLKFMTKDHHRELYEIHLRSDEPHCASFDEFEETLKLNPGFTMTNNGKVTGCINFGGYLPGQGIAIQFTMDTEDLSDWVLSPHDYRLLFGYCFDALQVRRVTGCSIMGITDRKEKFLQHLGFCHEGTLRESTKHTDGKYYSVKLFGLLKNEQKYLSQQGETP